MLPIPPHRADGVDDVACFQMIATRDLRLPGFAAAERAAFMHEIGSGGAMDRAIDAASA